MNDDQSKNGFLYVDTKEDAEACFGLMHQLRPHIGSIPEFLNRWKRQVQAGYRLLALWRDGQPVALAGYRIQDNMIHGPHIYVDDLVTAENDRGSGLGSRMMERLKQEAADLGFDRIALNASLTNAPGHRFYFRHGLSLAAVRFEAMVSSGTQINS